MTSEGLLDQIKRVVHGCILDTRRCDLVFYQGKPHGLPPGETILLSSNIVNIGPLDNLSHPLRVTVCYGTTNRSAESDQHLVGQPVQLVDFQKPEVVLGSTIFQRADTPHLSELTVYEAKFEIPENRASLLKRTQLLFPAEPEIES